MPTIVGGGKLRDPRRRTMRNSVSLLTSTLSRREREAAGLPPSAMARQWTTSSRRLVRLALGSAVSNRSAKIRRSQAAMSQKKRRVRKISAIRTPAAGRSANRLRYWLCTRLQTLPHIGHRQTLAETLFPITKPPSSLVALSTTNPRGTSSATSNPCIALIPSPNQSQTGASTSSKVSQPPDWMQISPATGSLFHEKRHPLPPPVQIEFEPSARPIIRVAGAMREWVADVAQAPVRAAFLPRLPDWPSLPPLIWPLGFFRQN